MVNIDLVIKAIHWHLCFRVDLANDPINVQAFAICTYSVDELMEELLMQISVLAPKVHELLLTI